MSEQFKEQTLSERTIFKGKVVHLVERDVRLDNGHRTVREVVYHPGAVAVLAEPMPDHILLVEQFRSATNHTLLELPAGKLEPGEHPNLCAQRELAEETGYIASNLTHVYSFYTSPGFADEKIHLFHADQLMSGPTHLDDDELVDVVLKSRKEVEMLLRSGKINDAKTLIGIQWWLHR